MELESNPAFVELSSNPVSQAFFSAAALRMKEEGSNAGFQKIMALMNELIHDNRRQLQKIRKINAHTQGECTIVTHKLKDRAVFFQGQTRYFKRRGSVTIEEKTEAVNIRNSRNAQNKSYAALLTAATARFGRKNRKWTSRCDNSRNAINKANAAIRAVNEWSPKTSHAFIQQAIKETADLYKTVKNYPLTVPEELIQLAANDKKLRKRLFQWLNYLKASIVDSLAKCQRARNSIQRLYKNLSATINLLRHALGDDAKKLGQTIENYTMLIKVYSQNERIYSNLFDQNNLLVQANRKYCDTELSNFKAGQSVMESQLNLFVKLRFWLRKNYHRIARWIKKQYASVQ
jgi:menaquinone-dependent protoporphyrinogen IX oxidase